MTRISYFILAWTSLILGVIGIILPLLPTTPFILLAAFGFSKSSVKFHQWLLAHSIFGSMVKDWEQGGVISFKAKLTATFSVIIMLTISFYFMNTSGLVTSVIISSVLLVFMFIWSRPSEVKSSKYETRL